MSDLAIIAAPLFFALGVAIVMLVRRRYIVPAEIDLEAPDMAKNIAEARDALNRFVERHDPRELKDIGWDLINIVESARRAEVQIRQAETLPTDQKEVAEALAAFGRLRDRVMQANRRIAQVRSGSWPAD